MDDKSIYFKPHAPNEIDIDSGEEMGPMAVLAEHINDAGKIKLSHQSQQTMKATLEMW